VLTNWTEAKRVALIRLARRSANARQPPGHACFLALCRARVRLTGVLLGWDRARARQLQVQGYRTCPFGCKAGSQFHHGCVSRGPPIIPDGRFSQARFGTMAFLPWAFSAWRGLSADSHTPRLPWFAHGLAPSPAEGLCRLGVRPPRCTMAPPRSRVPLPDVGVTCIREMCTVSCEDITPQSSLLRTHAPIPLSLLDFGLNLVLREHASPQTSLFVSEKKTRERVRGNVSARTAAPPKECEL
jgi:hypothetical protein